MEENKTSAETAVQGVDAQPPFAELEKDIDLNKLFPEADKDLNALFPDAEMRQLLKKVSKNKKDLSVMTQVFSQPAAGPQDGGLPGAE